MIRVAILSGIFLLLSLPALAQEPRTVGALGDPSVLDFEGNVTFTTRELRAGLSDSPGFWIAGHPDAPLREFKQDLSAQVREGYRHAGFGDVKVDVTYDRKAERLRVSVVEGTRYVAAPPVAKGGDGLHLEDHLAELEKTATEYWKPGEPALLDEETRKWFSACGERILENIGRRSFRVRTTIALDPEERVARPVISIEDPGVPATIRSVEVRGLSKNTEKQVIDLLAIPPGQVATRKFIHDLGTKLEATGRFAPASGGSRTDDEGRLVIELVEILGVPSLAEPLPESMKIMLRFREWLEGLEESDDELLFVFDRPEIGRGELALAPRLGFAADVTPKGTSRHYSAVVGRKEFSVYSHASCLRLAGATGKSGTVITIWFGVDPTDAEQMASVFVTLGYDPVAKGSRVRFQAGGSPAAFLRMAARAKAFSVDAGRGTFVFSKSRLVIDAATGRLLEFAGTEEGRSAQVRVVKGAFEAARKRVEIRGRDYLRMENFESGLGGLIEFAALDLLRTGADFGSDAAVLPRVLSGTVRAPLTDLGGRGQPIFGIPTRWSPDRLQRHRDQQLLPLLLPASNLLFAPGTWPRDLAREAVLAFAGSGKRSDQVMGRLYRSKEVGPLGCLAIAWLLDLAGNPAAPFFAKRGLAVATEDGFSRDIAVLVNGEGALGLYLQRLTSALRNLSPEDRKSLGALFSGLSRKHFGVLCGRYDDIADKGDRVGAYYTLLLLYRMGLDQWIRTGLKSLAD